MNRQAFAFFTGMFLVLTMITLFGMVNQARAFRPVDQDAWTSVDTTKYAGDYLYTLEEPVCGLTEGAFTVGHDESQKNVASYIYIPADKRWAHWTMEDSAMSTRFINAVWWDTLSATEIHHDKLDENNWSDYDFSAHGSTFSATFDQDMEKGSVRLSVWSSKNTDCLGYGKGSFTRVSQ